MNGGICLLYPQFCSGIRNREGRRPQQKAERLGYLHAQPLNNRWLRTRIRSSFRLHPSIPPSVNPSPTMSIPFRQQTKTFANVLVTSKTHFPLPRAPRVANVQRYPVTALSQSLFIKTIIPSWVDRRSIRTGSRSSLTAGITSAKFKMLIVGYTVRHEPKFGTYVNWPYQME